MLDNINYRFALTNQLEQLKQSAAESLSLAYSGGLFDVSHELIAFVSTLKTLQPENAIILDRNRNPIVISDVNDFCQQLLEIYTSVVSKLNDDISLVKKKRTITALNE